MSLIRKLVLFISLMTVGTIAARAESECKRLAQPTVSVEMNLGRVVVPPDTPVGKPFFTQSFGMDGNNEVIYKCSAGTTTFVGKIVASGVTDLGGKIYSTNVPGIGLRFSRGSDIINIQYPGEYVYRSNSDTSFSLYGSKFTLELIKTASVTGSGTLASGQYTSYDWVNGNNPILETYLNADSITIVSPSCTILSGKNMNVEVGTISRSDLSGVGTTAGGKDFSIELECSGGVSETGYANIKTSFSGTLATGTTASDGVLSNEKSGSSIAQGIGIQVLKEGKALRFDEAYNIGRLQNVQVSRITLPLKARFYQYGQAISSGEVESHMIFNLTYD